MERSHTRHLMALPTSVTGRCLEAFWHAVQAPADSAEAWLSAVARSLHRLFASDAPGASPSFLAATRLAVLAPSHDAQTPWHLLSLGEFTATGLAAALPDSREVSAALILGSRRDWPELSHHATSGAGPTWTFARRDLIPDGLWRTHPLHHARALLGLEDLLVSHAPIEPGNDRASLFLQLDQTAEQPWPEAELAETAALVTPYLARLLEHCVWHGLRRRQSLLGQVSTIQREILPLLVQGRTEREIAAKMHRSPHTIHDHVKSIYAVLGVSSRVQLLEAWHGRDHPHHAAEPAPAHPPACHALPVHHLA